VEGTGTGEVVVVRLVMPMYAFDSVKYLISALSSKNPTKKPELAAPPVSQFNTWLSIRLLLESKTEIIGGKTLGLGV